MVKRKVESVEISDVPAPNPLKRKKVSISSSPEDSGKLDSSTPTALIQSLLGDIKIDDFGATYWEKKPLVVKRNDKEFYGEILALSTVHEVVKNNELDFETDINVCRAVDNEKEILNGEGQVTVEEVQRLMKEEKGTIQLQHPQRYVDSLWNLVEKLETYFGCLVGSCAFVTPAGCRGSLPHCDDVDNFHIQLEGSQSWKLYKPMVELSRDYTQDLPQESLGEPMLDVVLEEGDMLYFPRGVIYQCENQNANGHSTHLSITTYQQNTWGDFMQHAVEQAITNGLEEDVGIRSGLPINYLSFLGTGKNMDQYVEDGDEKKTGEKFSNVSESKVVEFKEKVKAQLAKLIDHIDVNTASDSMCADFFASRLPPYGYIKKQEDDKELEEDKLPGLKNKIKIKYPTHVRVVYDDEDEDQSGDEDDDDSEDEDMPEDEERPPTKSSTDKSKKKASKSPAKANKKAADEDLDEDEDDEEADVEDDVEPHVKILHTLNNDRFWHMGGAVYDSESGCIRLHVSFAKAAVQLVNNSDKFTSVKDILMEDDEDKITLATLLFENGLIDVQAS